MSQLSNQTQSNEGVKTLAIRLHGVQHAQLSMIAQLENLTMIDAIRQSIDQWIEARRDRPELKQRAEALLEEFEQETASRREAIAALIDSATPDSLPKATTPGKQEQPSTTRRKEPIGFQPGRTAPSRGSGSAKS